MEKWLYERTAALERDHWWFRGRREIVRRAIERWCRPERNATILEVGCGSGGNLELLSRFGNVVALEPDVDAIALATQRGIGTIYRGHLPDDVPFGGARFDLVVLLDVLEHVERERAALENVVALLKPRGCLLLTVPAYQWMWSRHDEEHHHFRRYRLREMTRKLGEVGLHVEGATYFNAWLFPLIAGIRLVKRKLRRFRHADELRMPSAALNQVLTTLFASERHLIDRVRLGFGVSILACARKVEGARTWVSFTESYRHRLSRGVSESNAACVWRMM